jgi:hypothetical protein
MKSKDWQSGEAIKEDQAPDNNNAKPKRQTRRWRKRLFIFAIILSALFPIISAIHILMGDYTQEKVDQELNRIQATGAPVKLQDLIKTPPPKDRNAALIYRQASKKMPNLKEELFIADIAYGDRNLSKPADQKQAKELFQKYQSTFELIHKALAMPECEWESDWNLGNNLEYHHYAFLRSYARLLSSERAYLIHQGKLDDALFSTSDGFRLAQAANEPTIISCLVRGAVTSIAFNSLSQALNNNQPSPELARAFAEELYQEETKVIPVYVAAMKGERVLEIATAEEAYWPERNPAKYKNILNSRSNQIIEATGGRRLMKWYSASDELAFLSFMKEEIRLVALPYQTVINDPFAKSDPFKTLPWYPPRSAMFLTMILSPEIRAVVTTRDLDVAHLRIARTALLLKAYRSEHGEYPQHLSELGVPVPNDPYLEKPLTYRREGKGFVLYSWGPNLKDDGGHKPKDIKNWREEGDIILRCEH